MQQLISSVIFIDGIQHIQVGIFVYSAHFKTESAIAQFAHDP